MTAPTRPVLRYHGGKWRMAKRLIELFPPHRIYVEPYGGAASCLMQKRRSYAEVYNDLWDEVVNLFRVLREPEAAANLERLLRLTPFARREFEAAYEETPDPVERARRLVIRSFMGHGSGSPNRDYRTGFRNDSNRSGTTPAGDWKNYPNHLRAMTERLHGVCIENRPALQIIEEFDSPQTFFYVDPPYPLSTRPSAATRRNNVYAFEMSDDDHVELGAVLRAVKGMVLVSSYACPLYEQLYGDWKRIEFASFADGAKPRTEVLWLNPAAAKGMQQHLEFEERGD